MELGATSLDNLFTNIPTVFPNQVSRSLKLSPAAVNVNLGGESISHANPAAIYPMPRNKAEMLPNYL